MSIALYYIFFIYRISKVACPFFHHDKCTVNLILKSTTFRIFIFSLAALLAVTTSCNSQTQKDKVRQPGQAIADTGLLNFTSGVRSFLQDSKGNTWFGSDKEGVCLLKDGRFEYFTTANGLSHNQVRNIYEDQHGIVWFECGVGLSTYHGKRISVYNQRNYNVTTAWSAGDKDLWFKSDEIEGYNNREKVSGVFQYDGKQLVYRAFPVSPRTADELRFHYAISTPFLRAKNGTTWFGCYKALIGYTGSAFKILTEESLGLDGKTSSLHIRGFMEDSKGNLWIANNGTGVLVYDGKEAVNFTIKQKLTKEDTKGNSLDRAFSIAEDTSGNIWIGTVGSGIWRYDGQTVKNFTKSDGVESDHIWTIYKSRQGDLWFGGANPSGVYRFNGGAFERIY